MASSKGGRADRPTLHVVSDRRLSRPALLAAIRAAAENGVDWVHVRDHQAMAGDLFDLTCEILEVCRPHGVRVAVNDRIDVALAARADGVQLGSRSVPTAAARAIAGGLAIGASVHDVDTGVAAAAAGADWLVFGHLFATSSHPGEPPRALSELTRLSHAVRVPVIGIGGIGPREVDAVLAAGASGVAMISAILSAPNPAQATSDLRHALDRHFGSD